ncbi:MAG TPA: glycosyltransferase family 39 protein [Candidatus Binataceae bacterium]|nr:glycosyltransferase family 39 protein [Candidatus Binataceae bacterium]
MKQSVAVFDRIAASSAGRAATRIARSPRALALGLLALALVFGAVLRFHRLGPPDLSADEGASWAAASTPSVSEVVAMEHQLDPGKLPLYDLMLHGWIRVFGDGVSAMRGMSAALGMIAIVLVFVTVREICRSLGGQPGAAIGELAGGFAALIYAVNVAMVTSDRTVRMYPLAMDAELLQIFFLVRAQRRGGWLNYSGAGIFTAAMVAANFTACFLLLAEGLWFGCLLAAKSLGARAGGLAIFRPGAALTAGVALLAPLLPAAVASSQRAVAMGALDWIKMRPITWPYHVLFDAAGGHKLFWCFAALAGFGVWRQWRTAGLAAGFFAAWTAGPILGLMAVTYLVRPLEVPRYMLIAFVGMFALAAFGAASLRAGAMPLVLAAALLGLSLRPARHAIRHPREAAWREATEIAARQTAPDEPIAVFPEYCKNVVRYYLSPARRAAVRGENACGPPRVLILSGRGVMRAGQIAAMEKCYPRVVARLFLVEVRVR